MVSDGQNCTLANFTRTTDAPTRLRDALYRFRDAERDRWKFSKNTCGQVEIFENVDGSTQWRGHHDKMGASHALAKCPTYVRARAQAMWEERHSKWRTEKVTFEAVPREMLTQYSEHRDGAARTTVDLETFSHKDLDALRSLHRNAKVRITIEPVGES